MQTMIQHIQHFMTWVNIWTKEKQTSFDSFLWKIWSHLVWRKLCLVQQPEHSNIDSGHTCRIQLAYLKYLNSLIQIPAGARNVLKNLMDDTDVVTTAQLEVSNIACSAWHIKFLSTDKSWFFPFYLAIRRGKTWSLNTLKISTK